MTEHKQPSRWAVTATVLFYMAAALSMVIVNKWVLVTTQTPLFFLLAQLLIAVLLFIVTHFLGLFTISIKLDFQVCQQLMPMVILNVIGLRSVVFLFPHESIISKILHGLLSRIIGVAIPFTFRSVHYSEHQSNSVLIVPVMNLTYSTARIITA